MKWGKRSSCCWKRDDPPFRSSWKVRTSHQRTQCRGIFPTWKLMWKAGTLVSLIFVFIVIQWSMPTFLSFTSTSLNRQHKKIRYLIVQNTEEYWRILWRIWLLGVKRQNIIISLKFALSYSVRAKAPSLHLMRWLVYMPNLRRAHIHTVFLPSPEGWVSHGRRQKRRSDAINLLLSCMRCFTYNARKLTIAM